MSDVFDETGTAVPTTEDSPRADWTPMPDSLAQEDKRKTFGGEADGLREAAAEVEKAREAATRPPPGTDEDGILTRTYQYLKGESAGEAIPENQTITAERAARDVTMMRAHEAALQQPAPEDVAARIDGFRNELATNPPAQAQPDHGQQQATEAQPTTEQPQQPPDPATEVREALERSPALRLALEQEMATVEQSRAQYAQAARQAAQVAAAAVLADHPDLASLPGEQWPHALAAIAKVDPAKATAIEGKFNRVQALYNQSQQAEAAQRQIQAARFQEYAKD